MNKLTLFNNTENLLKKILEHYNKTEDELHQDTKTIKSWLETQVHLPEVMPDSHIRKFLIINKFSIEKTKQKIDMYYTLRGLLPDIYKDCNPKLPQMKKVLDNCYICIHPILVEDIYRVLFYKIRNPDNTLSPRDRIVTFFNVAEVRLHEDYIFYNIFVFDLANVTINDVTRLTPSFLLNLKAAYEKIFGIHIKAAYLVNAPPYISKVVEFLKTIMKPKIFERIHVHANAEILKDVFTDNILPKDYGGNGPSLEELTDLMRCKFEEYAKRFDKLDEMRVDESLRPQKLLNDDILGFHGNFKKISFD